MVTTITNTLSSATVELLIISITKSSKRWTHSTVHNLAIALLIPEQRPARVQHNEKDVELKMAAACLEFLFNYRWIP
jgi:hypothetical protein